MLLHIKYLNKTWFQSTDRGKKWGWEWTEVSFS